MSTRGFHPYARNMRTENGIALIGYDGSEDAAAAIRHAGSLLAPRPAVVTHVWDSLAALLLHTDVRGLTGSMREAAYELDEEDRRDAERVAAEGAELAREAGFDAEAHALQGKPKAWPTLLATADAIDAAVVVIGSRGQGAVKSALLGSVSSGLLHHTRRPVLVVPPTEEETPAGPALIAFDGSDASRAGIAAAAHLLAVREAVIETVWIPYSGVACRRRDRRASRRRQPSGGRARQDGGRRRHADCARRRTARRRGRARGARRGDGGCGAGVVSPKRQRRGARLACHRRRFTRTRTVRVERPWKRLLRPGP